MNSFSISEFDDGKLVEFACPSSRLRILNYFYAFSFLVSSIAFGGLLIKSWGAPFWAFVFSVLGSVAFPLGFYRFICRATEREKLFVNSTRLDIIRENIFFSEMRSFMISEISEFKFTREVEDSPKSSWFGSFDYNGQTTERKVIEDLHKEGRVSFKYRNEVVRFAKEMVSWEFSDLEIFLFDITSNDFRYNDDYELKNFPSQEK